MRIFQKKQSKLDTNCIAIQLNGCKLDPTDNIQYLGVYIDKFHSWDCHITQLSNTLSRANGILSKDILQRKKHYFLYIILFFTHL